MSRPTEVRGNQVYPGEELSRQRKQLSTKLHVGKVSITNTEQEVLCRWSKVQEWTVATEEVRR